MRRCCLVPLLRWWPLLTGHGGSRMVSGIEKGEGVHRIIAGLMMMAALWACDTTEARQTTIDTPTLQCAHCETTVKRAVEKVDGVRRVAVDLKAKQVRVSYNDGSTGPQALANAIAASGYDANGVSADSTAYASLPDCCKITGEHLSH